MTITTLVKTIQDIMRKDTGVDGDAQRISQMVWMLFMKIFDDREKEWEIKKPEYKSPIPTRFRWRNWASNPEGYTGEELIDFVNTELFPKLKILATAGGTPAQLTVGSIFEDGYNYMKSGTLLRQVVNKIEEEIDFNVKKERHLLGEIYEKILKDLQSAGNAGEYYTPRAVTQFMVEMVNPQIGETVLDPACGTGGFMTCTIDHVRKSISTPEQEKMLQHSLRGVEKKPLPHMLATTNMLLHEIDDPSFIRRDNYLSKPYTGWGPKDRVNCIITNPPFGGMEEDGVEKQFPKKFQTRETADLFLTLIIKLLKPGGHAAVVLPDGTLFGEGVKTRIKKALMDECNLHTIVRLPNGVFSPYTGIKTNLLFFTKGEPTRDIWYYEHPYPLGAKSYNKTKPIDIKEFDAEKAWWGEDTPAGRAKRIENGLAWKVTYEEVKAKGFNLDIKNPNAEGTKHGDPEDLLKDYKTLLQSIDKTRDTLKDALASALKSTQK